MGTYATFVVGFCGVSGAGKDYVANNIAQELTRFGVSSKILSIADQPKRLLSDLKGWPIEVFYSHKEEYPIGSEKNYREILIEFAEGEKKKKGEAVWINCALKELTQKCWEVILIPDIRFDIEWNEIQKVYPNSILVKVIRETGNPISRQYLIDQQMKTEPSFVWLNQPLPSRKQETMSEVLTILNENLNSLNNAELMLCFGTPGLTIEQEILKKVPSLPKADKDIEAFLQQKSLKRLAKVYEEYSTRPPPTPPVVKKTL